MHQTRKNSACRTILYKKKREHRKRNRKHWYLLGCLNQQRPRMDQTMTQCNERRRIYFGWNWSLNTQCIDLLWNLT